MNNLAKQTTMASQEATRAALLLAGAGPVGLGIKSFLLPNQFIDGGVTGISMLLAKLTPIPAEVPLWSIAAAIAVSAFTGIGFGVYPANKAARMDPVEALRHE